MAADRAAALDTATSEALAANITAGLPGSTESWTLDDVRACLAAYDGMGPEDLRGNLIAFLREVVPVAEELGLRLCCHPDDPPFPLLGLPRVNVGRLPITKSVLDAVPSHASGATLCTGSLGVRADFEPGGFRGGAGRPHPFRRICANTTRDAWAHGDRVGFEESAHLAGGHRHGRHDPRASGRGGAPPGRRTRGRGDPDAAGLTDMICWMT